VTSVLRPRRCAEGEVARGTVRILERLRELMESGYGL